MKKETKVQEYIERIRDELRYKDYFHAKELCVRASNTDSNNLCVKYMREFIEMHKKDNGRYEQLDILELCAYLYKSREYITAENWETLSAYIDCLANEIFEREHMSIIQLREEFYFVRDFRDSILYLGKYVDRLLEIIEEQQIKEKSINKLLQVVENLRQRLELRLEEVERDEKEREIEQEEEKYKKQRTRLVNRWVVGIAVGFLMVICIILICSGNTQM